MVDTSSLQDGSVALMLAMAIMTSFISSVWSMSSRQSVVVVEEGYSADFPAVASIFRSLAKRGRGVGVSLVLVLHHLSDSNTDSPWRHCSARPGSCTCPAKPKRPRPPTPNQLLGLGDLTDSIQQLAKGTHILIEGRPETRPPRVVCHVRTDLDRRVNYTDAAITGGTDAPPSPFDDQPTTTTPAVCLRGGRRGRRHRP